MAGDFFAEEYNVALFVGVLGTLTIMMSGCYIFHKWQHKKMKNAPDIIVPPKPRKKLLKFLRKASDSDEQQREEDIRQMELEAEGNFQTQTSTPGNEIDDYSQENEEEFYTVHL